jgi:hypothetical protein
VYDSRYTGSDGILRNTSYNGNYVANLLVGKEFKIGAKNTIGIGTKITRAGGRRYGIVDIATTEALKEIIFKDSAFNDLQFADYFRIDFKISWRLDKNESYLPNGGRRSSRPSKSSSIMCSEFKK